MEVSKRKMLVQMSGAPGTGKSTTAKSLAPLIKAIILDHDVIRSSLLHDDIAFDQAAKLAYRMNWDLVESMLQQNLSVIVDSPCNYREILDRGQALALTYGCDYWYVECRVEEFKVLDARLQARSPLRSQRTGIYQPPVDAPTDRSRSEHETLFRKWVESPCRPDRNVIIVNTTDALEGSGLRLLKQMYPGENQLSTVPEKPNRIVD